MRNNGRLFSMQRVIPIRDTTVSSLISVISYMCKDSSASEYFFEVPLYCSFFSMWIINCMNKCGEKIIYLENFNGEGVTTYYCMQRGINEPSPSFSCTKKETLLT